MKFQTGEIDTVPFWGLFEDEIVAENVISDLSAALRDTPTPQKRSGNGDYVIVFLLVDKLYISRRNCYAMVVNTIRARHIKAKFEMLSIPSDSVLVLSKNYIDDLPHYSSADQFCRVMSEIPSIQYCIPLDHYLE